MTETTTDHEVLAYAQALLRQRRRQLPEDRPEDVLDRLVLNRAGFGGNGITARTNAATATPSWGAPRDPVAVSFLEDVARSFPLSGWYVDLTSTRPILRW